MRQLYRSVRIDAIDEKLETLANKGIFMLGGPIDLGSVGGLLTNVLPMLSFEDKKPIWVLLDSPGGDITQGFAVHDFLRALVEQEWQVNILCIGQVASMAVAIMQAGTKRYSFPNTQFTIHQASLYSEGDDRIEVNKMAEETRELKRLNHIVLKIIADRSGIEMRQLLKRSKKTDYSINAEEAKKFGQHGLIDEIVTTFPFKL